MQYTDMISALPDNLLVKLDRMLMGWGLEGRVPFLDHRIVEFGLSLPDSMKSDRRQGKVFLKKWATRHIPKAHLYAPKRGFHVPVGEWLQGRFLKHLTEVLPDHPSIQIWFRPAGVRALLRECQPMGPTSRMVWALLQFALWYQMFVEGRGQRPPVKLDPLEMLAS